MSRHDYHDPHHGMRETYRDLEIEDLERKDALHKLCTAPGADDLTFGSLLSEMIRHMFRRIDGRAGPEGRHYTECLQCSGTDALRPAGQRPTIEMVLHDPDCLMLKHMPRLKAMANKGVT